MKSKYPFFLFFLCSCSSAMHCKSVERSFEQGKIDPETGERKNFKAEVKMQWDNNGPVIPPEKFKKRM